MNRKLWAEEQRLRHARDRSALLALLLWGIGGYLLYLSWQSAAALPHPWGNITLTGIYLVTFFYVFAIWPIPVTVEKVLRGPRPTAAGPLHHRGDHVIHYHGQPAGPEAQDGGSAIHAGSSPSASSREDVGGASSSDAGR
jgi:hypothetical protein